MCLFGERRVRQSRKCGKRIFPALSEKEGERAVSNKWRVCVWRAVREGEEENESIILSPLAIATVHWLRV